MSGTLSVLSKALIVAALFSAKAYAQTPAKSNNPPSRPRLNVAAQFEANMNNMVRSHSAFSSSQKISDFSALCSHKEMSVACMDSYLDGKLKGPISPVESTLLMAEAVTAALSLSLNPALPKKATQCQKIYLLGSWSYRILSAHIEADVGLPDYKTLTTEEERAEWKEVLKSNQAALPEATTGARSKVKGILTQSLQSFPENDGEIAACSRDLRKLVSRF